MNQGKVIYKNVHLISTYHPKKEYVTNFWTGNEFLTDEDFMTSLMGIAQELQKHTVKALIVDTRNFDLPISPDIQDWYNREIGPRYIKAGIKKMAFLLPKELVPRLSIAQTIAEKEAHSQITRYFDSFETAIDWVTE